MTTQELPPQNERKEIEGDNGFALRQLVLEDAQRYFDLIDADRGHFKHGQEHTPKKYPDVEAVRQSIEDPPRDRIRFGIWDGSTMVGSINLTQNRPDAAEIGYWVGGEYKGHGYARQATELLVDYSFKELGLQRITAWVAPENIPSVRTLEKAGFRRLTDSGPEVLYERVTVRPENT